jgi:hydroxymethylpyrimidine/phosphomethylpyrimidine kinase
MLEPNQSSTTPIALTIAGSDSGGGAGIQADLRTFSFHQVHGASAITCVTAQNTCGVTRVDALPAAAVIAQIEAVTSDMQVHATKVGMLLNREIIEAVAAVLKSANLANLVVDPVMVSRAGDKLIDDEAIDVFRRQLLPLAKILTPNVYEARLLAEMDIFTLEDMKTAAHKIQSLGPDAVIVKGGGLSGELRGVDVWFDGQQTEVLTTEFVDTNNTHGTGCTFSSAIAANLAKGLEPLAAARAAKEYVTEALKHSLSIGQGKGPVGHFYPLLRT